MFCLKSQMCQLITIKNLYCFKNFVLTIMNWTKSTFFRIILESCCNTFSMELQDPCSWVKRANLPFSKQDQIPQLGHNTISWQLASWLVLGWFWIWYRLLLGHQHIPQLGTTLEQVWWHVCKFSGAPGYSFPLEHLEQQSELCHNTPLVPAWIHNQLGHTVQ